MQVAPEPILRAGHDAVHLACIYCRRAALDGSASLPMIAQLMDAIHEVPQMLSQWGKHTVAELRTHLGCFQATKWPGMPDLVAHFDEKLRQYGQPAV